MNKESSIFIIRVLEVEKDLLISSRGCRHSTDEQMSKE